jgi:RNA polymerase sigma-70 factor (ECF subfamily)
MDLQEKLHLIQLSRGNMESFVYFHKKYQAKVYQYSLRFVRNKEIAEEITSDVFLKLWEKRTQLKTDNSLDGLIFKITKDYSISYLRKVAKSKSLRNLYIQNYLSSTVNPIEEAYFLRENLAIATAAIEQLPPKCKEVFRLRYMDNLSLIQIAEKLKISSNTVQNHLQKGKQIVKSYLQQHSDLVLFISISIATQLN